MIYRLQICHIVYVRDYQTFYRQGFLSGIQINDQGFKIVSTLAKGVCFFIRAVSVFLLLVFFTLAHNRHCFKMWIYFVFKLSFRL